MMQKENIRGWYNYFFYFIPAGRQQTKCWVSCTFVRNPSEFFTKILINIQCLTQKALEPALLPSVQYRPTYPVLEQSQ